MSDKGDSAVLSIDVPILMYHDVVDAASAEGRAAFTVTLERFREQLDYLERHGFTVLTLSSLLDVMRDGKLPRKSLALTFDDGYESFARIVVPELQRRSMSATVFVVAGAIGTTNTWDVDAGKPLSRLMGRDELRRVAAAGMEVGAHGLEHVDLTSCAESAARREIVASSEALRGLLGVAPSVFAYPFGRYSESNFSMLAQAGYRAAVSIFTDYPTVTHQRYAMRRIYIHQGDGPWRFAAKLTPTYARAMAFRDRIRGARCH